jgi:hypothetical protein
LSQGIVAIVPIVVDFFLHHWWINSFISHYCSSILLAHVNTPRWQGSLLSTCDFKVDFDSNNNLSFGYILCTL